jgi:Dolichyl-phosphate-mannose-protein mannosyltransferase
MAAGDSRRIHYGLLALTAVLPRLAVLLYERGEVTSAYVEKSDTFARTFVESGTYGFIPDVPSAYTQPLYGFFLVPLYWLFGHSWVVVGLAQIAVALGTAALVYELGRRFVSARAGLVAALVATVQPYVVWHDVHVNREILDQLLAAGVVLLALALVERPTLPVGAALGAVTGLAVLGNVRLALLPLLLAGFALACRRRDALVPALALVAASAVVIVPWVARNRGSVGCATLTTDARAFWKANNPATLPTLDSGKWIDDVPPIPGAAPTPEEAGALNRQTGRVVETDECEQMRFYRRRALAFIREHPRDKAELAAVGAQMLWQPSVTATEGRRDAGSRLDTARSWIEPAYMIPLYALALAGAPLLPRRLLGLMVLLLAYNTLAAMVFAGQTRYRVAWDFLVALAAGTALLALAARLAGVRR